MKHFSHLNTAERILTQYKGAEPFNIVLKEFFRADKKYGSRDRKAITQLCYCFFRLGAAAKDMIMTDRIVVGLFLCSTEPSEVLGALKQEWNEQATSPLNEKLEVVKSAVDIDSLFPWTEFLSDGIEIGPFIRSHLIQPDLYLRIRPQKERMVTEKLTKSGLLFKVISNDCLGLANASRIESVVEIDREVVVQDLNSQRTAEFMRRAIKESVADFEVWDCCAASGGKSIMLYDYAPKVMLTVSDLRVSILRNLKKRFEVAGIKKYESFVADLSKPLGSNLPRMQDLIIADLPCTGSGTWARTPEQLYYFREGLIAVYIENQRKILATIMPFVKPGGYLLYITCSVFKEENEGAVEFIESQSNFKLVELKLLAGYDNKADSLFVALFIREG